MDAMPIDLSDELRAWTSQLGASRNMLGIIEQRFLELPQGGTAVGSGINAHKQFAKYFAQEMTKLSGKKCKFVPSENFFHENKSPISFYSNSFSTTTTRCFFKK